MRWTFVILLLHCQALSAHNLYNNYSLDVVAETQKSIPSIESSFNTEFAEKFVANFDLNKPTEYSFQDLSDAAVYLTQLGETDKALNLLEWLHDKHPKEYNIVANLGATHELKNDLDSAEYYLHQAVSLSAKQTKNSDWVNLKIIAAKRSIKADPTWLLHHQVLDLNWDTTFYATSLEKNYTEEEEDSLRLIRYQIYKNQFDSLWHIGMEMKKRIPYTPAPNLLIANIMKELGYYFAINMSIKDAFIAYKIALYYDPNNLLGTLSALEELMPYFKKYEFDEAVFEERFHPALAFNEMHKQYLPQFRNQSEQKNNRLSPLYWQAGLAFVSLFLIAGFLFLNRTKNR